MQLFTFVHQLPVAGNIRRIPKLGRVEVNLNPFEWLVNRCAGVRIVRVAQHGIMDHCVALDCKKGIIHGVSSRFPVSLSEDIFRRVDGDDATALRAAEVRQIVKVAVEKRNELQINVNVMTDLRFSS